MIAFNRLPPPPDGQRAPPEDACTDRLSRGVSVPPEARLSMIAYTGQSALSGFPVSVNVNVSDSGPFTLTFTLTVTKGRQHQDPLCRHRGLLIPRGLTGKWAGTSAT